MTFLPGISLTKPVWNVLSSLSLKLTHVYLFMPSPHSDSKNQAFQGTVRCDLGWRRRSVFNELLFFNVVILFDIFTVLLFHIFYLFCLLADLLEGVEVNPERPSKKQSEHHMPSFGKDIQ